MRLKCETIRDRRKQVLSRVERMLRKRPYFTVLFYSADLDPQLDADEPAKRPVTTVRRRLAKMGIRTFVRLPESTELSNYLEIMFRI